MTVLPAFEQAGQSFCVPSMALILLVQVQSRVFTVKCSVSAKYCYITHELRLHQNDRCKRFTPV